MTERRFNKGTAIFLAIIIYISVSIIGFLFFWPANSNESIAGWNLSLWQSTLFPGIFVTLLVYQTLEWIAGAVTVIIAVIIKLLPALTFF